MTDDDGQWPPPPVVFGGQDGEGTGVRSAGEAPVEGDDRLPPPFVAPGVGRPPVPVARPSADAGMSLPADALILPDDPIRPPEPDGGLGAEPAAEPEWELDAEPAPDPGPVPELEERVFPLLEEPEEEPEQEPAHWAEGNRWEEPFEEGTQEAAIPLEEDLTAAEADPGQDPAEEVAALLEQMAGELRGGGGLRVQPDQESSRLEGLLRGVLAGYLAHREDDGG